MAKYIVYTTWYHEKGLRPPEGIFNKDGGRNYGSGNFSNVKALTKIYSFLNYLRISL